MCNFWELSCKVGEAVSEASDNVISQWAQSIMESLSTGMIKLGTWWASVGTPTLEGSDSPVGFIHSHTTWLVVAVAIGSFVVAGAQLAWTKRGEPARDLLRSMFTLVVTSTVGVSIAQLLVTASDDFSKWILSEAGMGDDGKFLSKILTVATMNPGSIGMMVIIVMGLLGLVANLVQFGLMFVRSAMLILLVGIVPLAGAATNTKWGQAWLSKTIAWFVAFLMFKPAASIVYAVAIKLIQGQTWNTTGDDFTSFVLGVIMMVLAVMALPALMAFIVPATGAIAGGGAGATASGAVMASGAMMTRRHMGSASGSTDSSSRASGASGSSSGGGEAASGASVTPGASVGAGGAGTSGAGGAAAGGSAAGGAAGASAGGSAAAGAAAGGPAGAAAGAAVEGAGKVVSAVKGAAQSAVADSTGSPSGAQTTTTPSPVTPSAPSAPSGSDAGSAVKHARSSFDDAGGATGSGEVSR